MALSSDTQGGTSGNSRRDRDGVPTDRCTKQVTGMNLARVTLHPCFALPQALPLKLQHLELKLPHRRSEA